MLLLSFDVTAAAVVEGEEVPVVKVREKASCSFELRDEWGFEGGLGTETYRCDW